MQVYDAPEHTGKWLVTKETCPFCGYRWVVVVPRGLSGYECPDCGYYDDRIWDVQEKHDD